MSAGCAHIHTPDMHAGDVQGLGRCLALHAAAGEAVVPYGLVFGLGLGVEP